MCVSNCNNCQKIREGDMKNHNAPIKKSSWFYKLLQWGNLVMHSHPELFHRSLQCTFQCLINQSLYLKKQVSYRDGRCKSQFLVDGQPGLDLFKFFGTWLLVFHYMLPAMAFIYFYGR